MPPRYIVIVYIRKIYNRIKGFNLKGNIIILAHTFSLYEKAFIVDMFKYDINIVTILVQCDWKEFIKEVKNKLLWRIYVRQFNVLIISF